MPNASLGLIHVASYGLSNARMTTIYEVRHANLVILIDQEGTIQKVADKIDRSHAQVSQLKNRNKHSGSAKTRSIGDDLARHIEDKFELTRGWMDVSHATANRPQLGALSSHEIEAILALRALSQKTRNSFMTELMKAAEDAQQFTAEVMARQGVKRLAANPAKSLPDRPDGVQEDSVPGEFT